MAAAQLDTLLQELLLSYSASAAWPTCKVLSLSVSTFLIRMFRVPELRAPTRYLAASCHQGSAKLLSQSAAGCAGGTWRKRPCRCTQIKSRTEHS